ncbi:MAG TPA: thioredoxin domain-containing protein [Terriglobia bacterium]|nr:thioredoxin domain-containing protein [Terriglobia bacterium]
MTQQTATSQPEGSQPNRLICEKSPYLLQHAHNPVDWYAWGPEAFEAAARENKPIFLSIGYATCHWCHVMERESFEDGQVAALMNEAFISIKVDREERPDIDQVYMRVCQMLTGSGGWPLTILMTPDKRPFFAGTYLPKGDRFGQMGMLHLIPRTRELWQERHGDILKSAEEIIAALEKVSPVSAGEMTASTLDAAFEELGSRFDSEHGGFGRAPKFPTPHTLLFLLRYWKRTGSQLALEMTEKTLCAMRRGGIYDHVGFGFHRYSTDAEWLAPHFEKMLYDQALLTMAYSEAYQATRKEEYARTTREILEYVSRMLTSPESGFFSAEDADSEGEEGKFYLWRKDEIHLILAPEEAALVVQAFNVSRQGNFVEQGRADGSGENILHQTATLPNIAAGLGISEEELESRWGAARQKLFARREKRVHPLLDDKVLTDWNGLMIAALANAAQSLNEPRYAEAAQRAADFILERMRAPGGGLLHRYREGQAAVAGNLDDYVFMAWGLIELYEANFNVKNLEAAIELNAYAHEHFWDKQTGGFYFTADNQEEVLIRAREIYDGAVPSGNSVALLNLLRLARMTGREDLEEKAAQLVTAFGASIKQSPAAYTQWMVALDFATGPAFEVVVSGDPQAEDTRAMLKALRSEYLPSKVILLRPGGQGTNEIIRLAGFTRDQAMLDGKATAYVCQNFRCHLPTTDIQQMMEFLHTGKL